MEIVKMCVNAPENEVDFVVLYDFDFAYNTYCVISPLRDDDKHIGVVVCKRISGRIEGIDDDDEWYQVVDYHDKYIAEQQEM